jgi:hypothetical protein
MTKATRKKTVLQNPEGKNLFRADKLKSATKELEV